MIKYHPDNKFIEQMQQAASAKNPVLPHRYSDVPRQQRV